MHLSKATLELCVDEKDYEKAIKTFAEYANQEVFKRRVETGRRFNVLRGGKEMPRIWKVRKAEPLSILGVNYSTFTEKAERNLFKGSI